MEIQRTQKSENNLGNKEKQDRELIVNDSRLITKLQSPKQHSGIALRIDKHNNRQKTEVQTSAYQ